MPCIHTRASASATRARTTHMRHTCYHTQRLKYSPKYSFEEKRCLCTKISNQPALVSKLMCKLFSNEFSGIEHAISILSKAKADAIWSKELS